MKRILLNGVWNTLTNIIGVIVGIISSVLIVRQLTPEEYGSFSYLLWLLNILGILGTLAFPPALTKIRSELLGVGSEEEAQALSTWIVMGLVAFNLILSGVTLIYAFSMEGGQRVYLTVMALLLIPNALSAVLRSYSWADQQYAGVAVITILGALVQFAIVMVSFQMGWRVPGYFAGFAASILIQSILLSFWRLGPIVRGGFAVRFQRPGKRTTHSYLGFALQSALVILITTVVWERSEIFFLQRYSDISQVGYYNLAFTIFSMFWTMGWALINSFYPALSNDFGAGRGVQLRSRMVQGIELSLLFSIPVSFGGLALIRYIIPLLYGSDMDPSVLVAQILYVGMIPVVLAGLLNLCFMATSHIRVVWILGFIMAIVNIALNLYFVPRNGAVGAAIANTLSQSLYSATMFVLVVRVFKLAIPWRRLGLLLVSGGAICLLLPLLIIGWLGMSWTVLISAALLAACGYLAALVALGYVHITSERAVLRPGRWLS